MGHKQPRGRITARRAATFLAALGVLVMSSGIALMVAATPANAVAAEVHKSYVCKYVNKPGGGTELLQTGQNPIWVDNNSISGKDTVQVGDKFADKHGYSVVIVANTDRLSPEPTVKDCGPAPEIGVANADAASNTPNCENNVASYTITEAEGVVTPFAESAPPAFNTTITLTATASSGFAFPGGASTKQIRVTFGSPATGCEEKLVLTPQEPSFTEPTCTTDAGVTLPTAPILDEARTAAAPLPQGVEVNGIRYTATGSLTPGGTVEVVATLVDSESTQFVGDAITHWSHRFVVPAGCSTVSPSVVESQVVVSPPKAKTPKAPKAHAATVTPTLVEAGLDSMSTQDLRGEQGLALMVAGMVMLAAAGGLGLRVRGAAARH